jgi:hypothetical protein
MRRGPAGPLGRGLPGVEMTPSLGYLPLAAGDAGGGVAGRRSIDSRVTVLTPGWELPGLRGMLLPVVYSFSATGSEAVFDSIAQPAARKQAASRERIKFFFMLGGMCG